MSAYLSAAGAAIALAGVDKLAGNRGYKGMFHDLGWSNAEMRTAAMVETIGGLLMLGSTTRRLGGVAVAAVSALMVVNELQKGQTKLAAPRALVLLAGLAAVRGRANH